MNLLTYFLFLSKCCLELSSSASSSFLCSLSEGWRVVGFIRFVWRAIKEKSSRIQQLVFIVSGES